MLRNLILVLLFLVGNRLLAQSVTISGTYQDKPFVEFVAEIANRHQLKIFFPKDSLEQLKFSESFNQTPLEVAFNRILFNTNYSFVSYSAYNHVVVYEINKDLSVKSLFSENSDSDQTIIFNGYIRDANTGEGIIGATVFIENLSRGTSTNHSGYFSFNIPAGAYRVKFNSVGYQEDVMDVDLRKNTTVNIDLFEKSIQLNAITIFEESMDQNITGTQMGRNEINIKTLKTIPPFLGEVDVFRGVILLPGVSTVGEGASGFNVRGGSVDQNLILLDGAPVFNPSHLFGFFSAFNGDLVNKVTLHRGGIPAQFGGRLSSILEVNLKEGSRETLKGSGGVGPVAARLALEGPIVKDQSSFLISGRTSYSNWLLKSLRDEQLSQSRTQFLDLNAKINHRINEKNALFLSTYMSQDGFKFASDTSYNWDNYAASLNWNYLISDNMVSSITGVFSKYQYLIEGEVPDNQYNLTSNINYRSIKADQTYISSEKNKYDFGAGLEWYDIAPGDLSPGLNSSLNPFNLEREKSLESYAYINNEREILPGINLMLGLRYSHFQKLGPGQQFSYEKNAPRSNGSITDTTRFGNGDVMKSYHGLEPRVALKIGLTPSSSIKLGYNRMRQNIHLISNTTAVTPVDVWKLSNEHIKPQISDQFALGYFKNFNQNTIETSVEVYYKDFNNIIDYKDGVSLLLNNNIEADLIAGIGRAYGLEMMVNKTMGRLTGWASYTYSRTERRVNGDFPEEQINEGNYYPSNFDKPHDLTLSGAYIFTKRITFSANFTYSTGRPTTLPVSRYRYRDYLVIEYSDRNQFRIPDYHRLDLSLTVEGSHKRKKKWHGSYTFSLYNVYGRENAYSIFVKPTGTMPQAFRLAVLGTVFPSFTYNFKF